MGRELHTNNAATVARTEDSRNLGKQMAYWVGMIAALQNDPHWQLIIRYGATQRRRKRIKRERKIDIPTDSDTERQKHMETKK